MIDRERQAEYCQVYADDLGRIYCADCAGLMRCPEMGGGWSHRDSPGEYCRYFTWRYGMESIEQHRRRYAVERGI